MLILLKKLDIIEKNRSKMKKTAKKVEYKLDLAKTLLALDLNDKNFYATLTDSEKKGYVALNLMRYMSSVNQASKMPQAILFANDIVNIGFWQLSKHQELQHLLLSICGFGSKQFHPWLGSKNGKQTSKLDKLLKQQWPSLSDQELEILKNKNTKQELLEFCKDLALDDKQIKEIENELGK